MIQFDSLCFNLMLFDDCAVLVCSYARCSAEHAAGVWRASSRDHAHPSHDGGGCSTGGTERGFVVLFYGRCVCVVCALRWY